MSSQPQQEAAVIAVAVQRPPMWKILVVGDANSGKTSFITRYAEKAFYTPRVPTLGIDFRVCLITIDDAVHRLQIWDTCGGERWGPRFVSASYYRGVSAVILLYDITNKNSYDSLMDKWIMGFRIHTANSDHRVLPVIVGSKLDLHGQRQVFREEAEAYARSIGALFYETSASTGENVDRVFEQTTRRLKTEGIPPFIYKKREAADEPKEKSCLLS